MFHTIRRLVGSGVDRRSILYLNLADDRLYPVRLADLDAVLPAHGELYPEQMAGTRYLFLDEVDEVEGWERRYVRRIYDTEDVRIFVTGSSSRLLTRDLAPALRGRSLGYEVFPLSFGEYAEFLGLPRRDYDRAADARLLHALETYLRWGGLPEIVLAEEALRPLIVAWSLTDPETREREVGAMRYGFERYPGAEGRLVAHETAGVPEAEPAFRYLSGSGEAV